MGFDTIEINLVVVVFFGKFQEEKIGEDHKRI